MTQTTVPVKGPGAGSALDRPKWNLIHAAGNGLWDDRVGGAGLTLSGDSATLAPLTYRWEGFVLVSDAPVVFTVPATAGTYVVGVVATDSAEGSSWLSVQCGASGFSPPSSGVVVRKLWEFVRAASTPLSSSTVAYDRRHWAGETVAAGTVAALPDSPLGSVGHVGGLVYYRRLVSGAAAWVDHDDLPWTLAGGGALAPETGTASGELRNGEVALAGNLRRVNGNPLPFAGEDVILATFARAWAPEYAQRFTVPTEQRHVSAELFVDGNHDTGSGFVGRLGMLAPTDAALATFKRVHLSPVRWRPRGPLPV